jgi:hypothetical protein
MTVDSCGTPSVGNLYQELAQATANAAHNATNAQQQAYIVAQAATTMGVSMIYSNDTAATGEAINKIFKDSTAELQRVAQAATAEVAAPSAVSGAPGDIAYGMRAVMDAFAASLEALGEPIYHGMLHVLQLAATASCLAAMIAQPDKASSFEEVLAAIRRME